MQKFLIFTLLTLSFNGWGSRTVAVSGKCEIKVTPDRGSVQLRMEKTTDSVNASVKEVTQKINLLRVAIKKMNLKDLELSTTQFNVSPHHEWQNNKNVFKGYKATQGLEVITSEISRLAEVMGSAAKIGITGTENYRTFLSLQKSQAEYLNCLDVASVDAHKKAERLAKKLGAKLGEVETIVESQPQVQSPGPIMMMEASMAKSSARDAEPEIDVADHTYSTSLRVTFILK